MNLLLKTSFILLCTVILSIFIISCDEENGKVLNKKDLVCCEIYGYGAKMKKCCIKYTIMNKSNCRVPENFVGGGRRIVDDSFCTK